MSQTLSSSMRLHGLDTLRALAIVAVMLYHFKIQGLLPQAIEPLARIGWVGVDMFFVLSGFLIGSQLLRPYVIGRQPSLKDFYTRRAYRILPAFGVVLLLYIAVPLWREAPGPYAGWQYGTFTWNLLLLGYPNNRAFSHVWSLCVEEHFYLVLPPLVLMLMRRPSARTAAIVVFSLFMGGVGLRAWIMHSVIASSGDDAGLMMMKYIYYPTYSRLDGLLVGVSLALISVFRPEWWSRLTGHVVLLPLAGLCTVIGGLQLCNFDYPSPDLPYSILFAFPVLACGFGILVASAAANRGFMTRQVPGASGLAALAFSLYLTHKSVAHAVHGLLPGATADPGWQASGIYAVTCVCVACVLYFLVERPCVALRIRRSPLHNSAAVDKEVRVDPAV